MAFAPSHLNNRRIKTGPLTLQQQRGKSEKLHQILERQNQQCSRDLIKSYLIKHIDAQHRQQIASLPAARMVMEETIDLLAAGARSRNQDKHVLPPKNLLNEAEQRLKEELAKLPPPCSSSSPSCSISATTTHDNNTASNAEPDRLKEVSTTTTMATTTSKGRYHRKDIAAEAREKAQQEKLVKTQRAITYCAELDKQRIQLEESKKRSEAERLADLQRSKQAQEAYMLDEMEKEQARKKKEKENKIWAVEMMRRKEKQRQAEKEAKLAVERLENERARRLIQEEQELIKEKKLAEKARQKWIEEEFSAELERRKIVAMESMKEDIRLTQAYTKKLEKEEQDRKEAFSKRTAKLQVLGKMFSETGAGKTQEEAIRRQDQLIQEAAMRKLKEIEEKEAKKKHDLFVQRKEIAEYNLKMKERVTERKLHAKEDIKREMDEIQRQIAAIKATDSKLQQTQKEKQRAYLLALQKQMLEKEKMREDLKELERIEGMEWEPEP